jgi:uncharacterized membrane protein
MTNAADPPAGSPDPISSSAQDNLKVMADMSEQEDARVDPLRSLIESASSLFGTPRYFVAVLLVIVVWIALNLWDREHGWPYDDPRRSSGSKASSVRTRSC